MGVDSNVVFVLAFMWMMEISKENSIWNVIGWRLEIRIRKWRVFDLSDLAPLAIRIQSCIEEELVDGGFLVV